jgi:predicted RNase H-like HicB family nuclease
MKKTFKAFVEYDDESKLNVGIIPNVPGAHTQAETLDELQRNLQEVLELCLEENPEIANEAASIVCWIAEGGEGTREKVISDQ